MTFGHYHDRQSQDEGATPVGIQERKLREFERRGQDILAAALELFHSDDWEQVTVDSIAQRAEVGKGTIYKHFASKDEIYATLAIGFQQRTLERLKEVNTDLPVVERFRQHLRVAWEMHLSSQALHRVFLYCSRSEFRARLSPAMLERMQAIEAQAARPTAELIELGMAQGIFPRRPLTLVMFGAQAAFWGGIQLVWSGYLGDVDRARCLESLADFLLAGLIHSRAGLSADAPDCS